MRATVTLYLQFFKKGSANLCGLLEVVNEEFSDEAIKKAVEDRLVPRTQELPIYTPKEFNDKVNRRLHTLRELRFSKLEERSIA